MTSQRHQSADLLKRGFADSVAVAKKLDAESFHKITQGAINALLPCADLLVHKFLRFLVCRNACEDDELKEEMTETYAKEVAEKDFADGPAEFCREFIADYLAGTDNVDDPMVVLTNMAVLAPPKDGARPKKLSELTERAGAEAIRRRADEGNAANAFLVKADGCDDEGVRKRVDDVVRSIALFESSSRMEALGCLVDPANADVWGICADRCFDDGCTPPEAMWRTLVGTATCDPDVVQRMRFSLLMCFKYAEQAIREVAKDGSAERSGDFDPISSSLLTLAEGRPTRGESETAAVEDEASASADAGGGSAPADGDEDDDDDLTVVKLPSASASAPGDENRRLSTDEASRTKESLRIWAAERAAMAAR